MKHYNIKNIENVEGKYHLMFLEGKNIIQSAKAELRYAWGSLLLFAAAVLLFIVISGFNLFYVGFGFVFLIFFVTMVIYLWREKRKGLKQCVHAVQNSHSTDIVNKQVDKRKISKAFVKSMSNTLDAYDVKSQYSNPVKKYFRRKKHNHIAGMIVEFEDEKAKRNKTK